MYFFVTYNYFFCIYTSIILIFVIFLRRFLLIKPSILVILFFHLTIQWAGTFESGYIWYYLPNPWIFAFLLHGFPIVGLSISFMTWRKNAKKIFKRLLCYKQDLKKRDAIIAILGFCVALITVLYLSYIPFYKTGLWAIFTDYQNAAQARENSLKLLDNIFLKYSYSFVMTVFAPLLSVLLFNRLRYSLKKKLLIKSAIDIVFLFGLLVSVSWTGARSPAAYIILVVCFSFFLKKGLPIKPFHIILTFLLVLTLPTFLTLLREGKALSISLFWQYLRSGILGRVFHVPMLTGLWHVHYAQNEGFIGIAGIPKLAVLFGVEPINMPNLIGITYTNSPLESVSSNTCYLFSYYSYFGWLSFPISLLGLWLLDYSIWVYKQLSDKLLLPCVASVSLSSIFFVSGDYTTVWLSQGFGVILILSLILDIGFKSNLRFDYKAK